MRALGRGLSWLGWGALALAAAAGVALSGLALLAALPATRPFIASRVVALLDEAIAGSLVLEGVEVLARGGIELRGLEVYDPQGHLVLSVGRARVFTDITGLRTRALGVSLELESPSVLLEEEAAGGVSLARAFAPSGRSAAPGAPDAGRARGGGGWTVHVSRLTVRRGDVWWVDGRGETRLEASALELDARGLVGPRRVRADLRLRGALAVPVEGPIALDVVGGLTGDAVRIPVLRAQVGGTTLSAVAEGDLARRSGRLAISRLGLARETARAFVPRAPEGDDLAASAYAETDGRALTVALRTEPAAGARGGRADAALAARLEAPAGALGFDVALDRLDPSRLVADAPAGDVTLAARGAAAGRSLRDLRGRVSATVQRSRLRQGEIARAELQARADRGAVEVTRARISAPGVEIDATLRWRDGGGVSGRVAADARDLGPAVANAGALLGRRLPRLAGSVRAGGSLAGTSAAPTAALTVDAPQLRTGGLELEGVHLQADVAGPLEAPSARVEGRVASVRGGASEVARAVVLHGSFAQELAEVTATAALPGFRDPATLTGRGGLGPRRESFLVSELRFTYPAGRWALAAPATVTFAGPAVDRLELVSDGQRLALAGGLVRGRAVDARLEVAGLDLARLPAGLLPAEHAIRGALTADVAATGTLAGPELAGTFSLANGAFRGLEGLSLFGSASWSGADRRARASVAVARADGGTVDVDADVPLPLAGRPAERVLVRARAREVPIEELLAAAGDDSPAAGLLGLDLALEGTAGAPALSAGVTVADGEWEDLGDLQLEVAVEDPGERMRLSVHGSLGGKRVVALDAEAPLDVSDLLERPAAALRAARTAPLEGSLAVTRLDLEAVSGRAGVPPRLAGIVDGSAALSGSIAALRATGTVDLRDGVWAGYRELSGHVDLALGQAEVAVQGRVAVASDDALRFEVSLRAPVERLVSGEGLRAAPLRAEARVPRLALARAASDLPLAGTLDGHLTAAGTLRAPEVTLALAGDGITVEGRPLGKARLEGRYAAARTRVEVLLEPAAGGELRADLAVTWDLGLGAARGPLREAPAELTAVAEALGLGFLPAAAPGVVRAAGGTLSANLRASGPLGRPSPRGTLRVTDGRIALAQLGEWTGIAVDASVTEDAVELARVEVRRGAGRLGLTGSLRGLASRERPALEAHLVSEGFGLSRYGMDVATVDLRADATGSYDGATLAVEVTIPKGVVRLPPRQPRELQTLEPRKDIQIGRRAERRRRAKAPAGAVAPAAASERPFTLKARVRVDRNLFVKSDDPRVDVELKADVEYERAGGADYAQGFVEVIRGSVEPLAGRPFVVERGRVQFTGGPPGASMLDVQARYDNPAAVVTVNVQGPTTKPEIQLHSQPPMDDAQIAMLIATGRLEIKAGSGGVGTLTGEEAGKAALAAIATRAFKDLVANKLPLDTVAIESGALRAGKYVTDKIYVGYTRRFDADPQRGENADEVRVEYQINPRWTFESRYGNAQSGGANLIWSRQY